MRLRHLSWTGKVLATTPQIGLGRCSTSVTELVLVDNDIVLKLCRFGCHAQLSAALGDTPPAILSVARYSLRDRVLRSKGIVNRDLVAVAVEQMIASLTLVQPVEAEIALAAELEEQAARRAMDLDTGESQLLAILLNRAAPLLLTGDKRAVVSIHGLGITGADGRIACLEQLLATLLNLASVDALRAGVCSDQAADQATTACFACWSPSVTDAEVRAGLHSYVAHLRLASGALLFVGDDLSALPR